MRALSQIRYRLRTSGHGLAVLAAILYLAVQHPALAQDSGERDTGLSGPASEEPREGRRPARRPQAEVEGEESNDDLEEVIVLADRVEGGGRRRADADRRALDRSNLTDMEDFFDEIDGISTLGGDGEGNAFSIDGLSADLGKVTLDGQGFGQGRGSGGMSAGDLPSDMILRVDVFRTPTAAMEEGGVSGRVNLRMRNPVDITGDSSSFRGRLSWVPDRHEINPSGSFTIGRPSEDRTFGYMLSANLSERTNPYGSQDISDWIPADFDGASGHIPSQVRNNDVTTEQSGLFAGLTVGFKPRPSLDVSAKLLLSSDERDTVNQSLQHRFNRQRNIDALAFDERIVTELESDDRSRRNLRIAGSTRQDSIDSMILGLDLSWRHEDWRLDAAVGHNTVENSSDPANRSIVFEAQSAFGYRAGNDGSLWMSYRNGLSPVDEFTSGRINLNERTTDDTNSYASLDVTRQTGDGFLRRIRFGGKLREMSRDRDSAKARINLEDQLSLSEYSDDRFLQTPWDAEAWPAIDLGAVDALVQSSQPAWEENLLNEYDVQRRTAAAYIQADFRHSISEQRFLVGNVGLRAVRTDSRIAGYEFGNDAPQPLALDTDYTDFLPSLTLRMRVAERTALTLGAARVMAHPDFNSLAPGIRLDQVDKTARSGNPNLEPFRANQFLAEISWVPERGRRLTGSLIYRDVKSYFALGEESLEIDDDTFLVTRPINGKDGHVLTATVKVNQNLRRMSERLQNVAVALSYTRNESSTDLDDPWTGESLPLPNTAEYVARAEISYTRQPFAAKLLYQWQGESLRSSFTESGLSAWNKPTGSLNFNLGWQLNEKLQFSLDGRNLLNEERVQTSDYAGQLWRITERNRTVSATLRARW